MRLRFENYGSLHCAIDQETQHRKPVTLPRVPCFSLSKATAFNEHSDTNVYCRKPNIEGRGTPTRVTRVRGSFGEEGQKRETLLAPKTPPTSAYAGRLRLTAQEKVRTRCGCLLVWCLTRALFCGACRRCGSCRPRPRRR